MKILLINGTIIGGGKTNTLLHETKTYLHQIRDDVETELLDLQNYSMEFVDGRPFDQYNEETREVIEKVTSADGYIFATPIFQASIPGTFKNMFDHIHPDALRYKPAAIVANGGTYQHHLVAENQLKPILDYFRCLIVPNYVYTHTSHFSEQNELIDEDIQNRLKELTRVFSAYLDMGKKLKAE
ncbi:FMN reductase [Melghiribacillus thermohalophilus]|uniref:FMN reductase n=1 Tax=Melghiribacillus thermohalophilus TaxID=1324956 RepID=A0A4R3MV02_9BACI|nr:NAD(P)H-dependent oxidoreductase [Melghiribacillus thermohalophilus]TCT20340.1 FMN reductase [Melghiribacillus thermohalophilus]